MDCELRESTDASGERVGRVAAAAAAAAICCCIDLMKELYGGVSKIYDSDFVWVFFFCLVVVGFCLISKQPRYN